MRGIILLLSATLLSLTQSLHSNHHRQCLPQRISPRAHCASRPTYFNPQRSMPSSTLMATRNGVPLDDHSSDDRGASGRQRRWQLARTKSLGRHTLAKLSSALQWLQTRIRHWKRHRLVALALSFSLFTFAPRPAAAKFSYELSESQTHSLRPGMNAKEAATLESGDQEQAEAVLKKTASVFDKPSSTSSSSSTAKTGTAKKKATSSSLYGDDEEDDDILEDEDVIGTVGSQSDQAVAAKLKGRTSSEFAAYNKGKSTSLTVKVALSLFVPTFGGMFVREFIRRGKEEAYVKKGLEILEAQKAEYFNVTSTAEDSDVQDALKGLKNKTKTDDDEEEDEDDEDEDYGPPSSSRKRPKGPRGGNDDDGDGGDAGGDPGYGRPSDEDLDRLNKMFGKS